MDQIDKLKEISNNLWYTWNPKAQILLHPLETYIRKYRQSAYQTLTALPPASIRALLKFKGVDEQIDEVYREFTNYLSQETWFNKQAKANPEWQVFQKSPIAYFSMEFGLVDWLQMYSGGLGILAGDTIKTSSDFGLPLLGITLLYQHGYFIQSFSWQGEQDEYYPSFDPATFPLAKVLDSNGKPILIQVSFAKTSVFLQIWKMQIGRNSLFFLDANVEQNSEVNKAITGYLYGGDEVMRLKQEIILGIGGKRALQAMGIVPSVYHLNEGHSSFVVLESATQYLRTHKVSFQKALEHTRHKVVFTNHTLLPAGNDLYPKELVVKYLNQHASHIQIPVKEIFDLGKVIQNGQEQFSMTQFSMRATGFKNTVSQKHAQSAKSIWPDHQLTPITNGIHLRTWVAPEFQTIYDQFLSKSWKEPGADKELWEQIHKVPSDKLYWAKKEAKSRLKRYLAKEYELNIQDDILTIVWARRFAAYKRPTLLLTDKEHLHDLLFNAQRPIQIIFSGKAHPVDKEGEKLLKEVYLLSKDSLFKDRLFYVPRYNWNKARLLCAASDIWLNTPIVGNEASGTSGMKAAINGALQLSIDDGWISEAELQSIGWIIQDNRDNIIAQTIYKLLQTEIAPLYYQNGQNSYSAEWFERMLKTIQKVGSYFNTERMLEEYLHKMYLPVIRSQN